MSANANIRRVEATGDPFAIGVALGRAAAADIRERSFATEEFRALKAKWLGTDYLGHLEAAARANYPEYLREIEGIAEGAGEAFETLFLWNCRGDLRLPENVSAETLLAAASGCTSVMVPASGDGPAVIAHNEDGAPQLAGHCFWVSVKPDDGPAFESFMYPGMLPGHTFGLNGAGLVQAINNVRAHDLKPGIPRHLVCRAVLGAETLDGALAILQRHDRASGFHHNLGEAGSRRLVSVEAPASGCEATEIEKPFAHANHLIAEPFADTPQEITGSSRDRQAQAGVMVGEGASPDAILFERETPVYRANDDGDDYSQTLATVVFELGETGIAWRIHASADERSTLSGSVTLQRSAASIRSRA